MKVALVGLGYWGKIMLPILIAEQFRLGYYIKWVCDHHNENWRKFQKRNPKILFGKDVNDLFRYEAV